MDTNLSNEKIVEFFKPEINDEVILWSNEQNYYGFSVLRDYKENLGFTPALTKLGLSDTKVLIKIGFRFLKENKQTDLPLFITVGKYSKYKAIHFGINFEDVDAPTPESLSESERSKQPIDLEERNRFWVNIESLNFFDKEKNKKVSLNDIVDYMYNLHLATISSRKGVMLKFKLNIRQWICGIFIPKIISILKEYALPIFGKSLSENKGDFLVGIFKPYSFLKHISTKYPNSLPFFQSDFRVSMLNILWVSVSLLLSWYFYFNNQDNFGEVFSIGLVFLLIIIFEFIFPWLILSSINLLILFRNWYEQQQFIFK